MPKRRKRKASACPGSGQAKGPACKLVRPTLLQRSAKDTTHGVTGKFPWGSLPKDLQERIMAILTVRETARLMCATKSHETRAIHQDMMRKRHEALRDLLRARFGDDAAALMPPLDMADPGDVYITPPIPPLLQLRPHRAHCKRGTVTVVDFNLFDMLLFFDHPLANDLGLAAGGYQLAGRLQGYFRQAGLEGWGRWDAGTRSAPSIESFEGEWRAGKRHRGTWTSGTGRVCTGGFINDRLQGPTVDVDTDGRAYDCVYENGRLLTWQLRGSQL